MTDQPPLTTPNMIFPPAPLRSGYLFLKYVNPGVTDQGHAVFIGAPDPRGFKLALGDADLLSNEHGTVPLCI